MSATRVGLSHSSNASTTIDRPSCVLSSITSTTIRSSIRPGMGTWGTGAASTGDWSSSGGDYQSTRETDEQGIQLCESCDIVLSVLHWK